MILGPRRRRVKIQEKKEEMGKGLGGKEEMDMVGKEGWGMGGEICVILKMEVMVRSKVQGWLRKKRKS